MKIEEYAPAHFTVESDSGVEKVSLTEYLEAAKRTAGKCDDLYLSLGMVGESGEIVDVLKKIIRDLNNGLPLKKALERKDKLADELGDFLWYCVVFHAEFVTDTVHFMNTPCLDIAQAVTSALDLTMCSTEWAALVSNGTTLKTEETLHTALYNVSDICSAMEIDIYDVMLKNIKKLEERYTDGFKVGVK